MAEKSNYWWIHWSHIRSYFYVYTYAFGYLVSRYLKQLVIENPVNIEKVTQLLSAGGSLSPKEALKLVDFDIYNKSNWETGVLAIRQLLKECKELASSV